jgi:hypothetical protein
MDTRYAMLLPLCCLLLFRYESSIVKRGIVHLIYALSVSPWFSPLQNVLAILQLRSDWPNRWTTRSLFNLTNYIILRLGVYPLLACV